MIRGGSWPFDAPPNLAVVTTKHVTSGETPILFVSREPDDEAGELWQFHSDNGDYRPAVLQLVALEEIARRDPRILELADLPIGFEATRTTVDAAWVRRRKD